MSQIPVDIAETLAYLRRRDANEPDWFFETNGDPITVTAIEIFGGRAKDVRFLLQYIDRLERQLEEARRL